MARTHPITASKKLEVIKEVDGYLKFYRNINPNVACMFPTEHLQYYGINAAVIGNIRNEYPNELAIVYTPSTRMYHIYHKSLSALDENNIIIAVHRTADSMQRMHAEGIHGKEGGDTMIGINSTAGEVFYGGAGMDMLYGSYEGSNKLYGEDGSDVLCGGPFADELLSGEGHDFLMGGSGDDIIEGGEGNDALIGNADVNILKGGAGDDYYFFTGAGLQKIQDCEGLNFLVIHKDVRQSVSGTLGEYLQIVLEGRVLKIGLGTAPSFNLQQFQHGFLIENARNNSDCVPMGVYDGYEYCDLVQAIADQWQLSNCASSHTIREEL